MSKTAWFKIPASEPPVRLLPEAKAKGPESKNALRAFPRTTGSTRSNTLPPMLDSTIRVRHTYRYRVSTTVAAATIGVGDILLACGAVATGTTSITSISSSFKLHSVKAWLPLTTGVNTPFQVEWGATGPSSFVRDTNVMQSVPDGITTSNYCMFTPPKDVLGSFWINSSKSADVVLFLYALAGTIIDFDIESTIANEFIGVTATITGGSAGSLYYTAIDGPGASNKLVPVGLQTIF